MIYGSSRGAVNEQPARSKQSLYLKVNANRAADLAPSPTSDTQLNSSGSETPKSSRGRINPIMVAQINGVRRKTSRKLHSSHPSWDETLVIPLEKGSISQLLTLAIWDKHKRYKNYLGELRLVLNDLFFHEGQFTPQTELQWFRLYSNSTSQSFVNGSLLLSFQLVCKQRKKLGRAHRREKFYNSASASSTSIHKDGPNKHVGNDLPNHLRHLDLSESDNDEAYQSRTTIQSMFEEWQKSLVYPEVEKHLTKPNDQGFYSDSGEIQRVFISETSDIESIITSDKVDVNSSIDQSSLTGQQQVPSFVLEPASDAASSALSSHSNSSDSNYENMMNGLEASGQKYSRFRGKGLTKASEKRLEITNKKISGVIFFEIVSCSDLPPFKNITRTTFDMDPFVVVTFGKKTFRTSYKRHTLNPLFNERLAFEILPHETNYNIQFSVLDKDRFSFHDNVADTTLKIRNLIDLSTDKSSLKSGNSTASLSNVSSSAENPDSLEDNSVEILENDPIQTEKRKVFNRLKKKRTVSYADTLKFKVMNLSLNMHKEIYVGKYFPTLKIRVRFEPYDSLRRQFWELLLDQYHVEDSKQLDFIELMSFLDTLGCHNSDNIVQKIFEKYGRLPWGGDKLSYEEVVDSLEEHIEASESEEEKIFEIERCPLCLQKKLDKKQDIDIVTHVAICASKDWSIVNKLLVSSYVSPQIASRRWFSKVLMKVTYGKYKLGGNSAMILVQDRVTGIIMEEKMGIYVRLGIRLLYKGLDKAKSRRVRTVLKKLSIKQGAKFDVPQSKADIPSFIKFHKLDMSECLQPDPSKYSTFNEFFYRKLKPGARLIECKDDDNIMVSPADCRSTTFATVNDATSLWIKGRNFTVAKLFNGNYSNLENSDIYKAQSCSLGIFRLAPQDYHRFHSPVKGTIGAPKYIGGEYYTVNPMAIRSELDVYGENVRVLIPIKTETFGTIIMVAVGAMMVGSTILTVKEGDEVQKGDEVGYFKFGGSTILLLIEKEKFSFDSDLLNNSNSCIETLITVGQSIGHASHVEEYKREHLDFGKQSKDFKLHLIRVMTGGDLEPGEEPKSWDASKLQLSAKDVAELEKEGDASTTDDDSLDETESTKI